MKTKQELDELLQKVAVNCDTEEETYKVLMLADKVGYRWHDGTSFIKNSIHNYYTNEFNCYYFLKGTCGSKSFYKINNYKIITAQEFIDLVNREDMKKEFTKNDLKSGMVVKLRNGEKYLVVDDLLITSDGFMRLSSYNINMICNVTNNDFAVKYDIMEVYAKTYSWGSGFKINLNHGELLWKRKEIKHYTKEDIAKMINMNVDDFVID